MFSVRHAITQYELSPRIGEYKRRFLRNLRIMHGFDTESLRPIFAPV